MAALGSGELEDDEQPIFRTTIHSAKQLYAGTKELR